MAVFRNSIAMTTSSTPIIATYQGGFGAMKKPTGIATARTTVSSRTAASVVTPSTIPRHEFLVALKSRFTARNRLPGTGAIPARVAARGCADYSAARNSERSAARLAHQSGGLGVASSNLAAPTRHPIEKHKVSRPRNANSLASCCAVSPPFATALNEKSVYRGHYARIERRT
jgi:hypothetical protein